MFEESFQSEGMEVNQNTELKKDFRAHRRCKNQKTTSESLHYHQKDK